MNLIELPISILDAIISNINDTKSYAILRLTCKSFHNLLTEVKRFYNNKSLKEMFIFKNGILNGYHVKWYINQQLSYMGLYLDGNREKEETFYYPSGNLKISKYYLNNLLNGFEKHYTNYNKSIIKYCEYKNGDKINDEIIYNKYGDILFKKTYINNYIYKLFYYDSNYKIIEATFINNILQGTHIIKYIFSNYLKYDSIIQKFNYGELTSYSKYFKSNLIEKFNIKNGKKNGWAFKWYNNNKLKSLSYFNQNNYNRILKLWEENGHLTESIQFDNNKPNGYYKSSSKYISRKIPYTNSKINGYVEEKIKCINLNYSIKFSNNNFDHVITKSNDIFREEIYLDTDYFSYTKYKYNKKVYSLKLLNNYVIISFYDKNEIKIYDYSKTLYMYV